MEIIICPNCKTRMIPNSDGTCASCSKPLDARPLISPEDSREDEFHPKPLGTVLLLVGVGMLAGLYGIAQLLQLLGVIGAGFSGAGLAVTAISFVIAVLCFKHASAPG